MLELLLALTPLLLLVTALLFGRYPGVEAIVWLARQIASISRRRTTRHQPRPHARYSQAVSGGLLLAFGFAQRPPPLAP